MAYSKSIWNGYNVHGEVKELDAIVEAEGFISLDKDDIIETLSDEAKNHVAIGVDTNLRGAYEEAFRILPCGIEQVASLLIYFFCGTTQTNFSDLAPITGYLNELKEEVSIKWGIALDESLGENFKVVIVTSYIPIDYDDNYFIRREKLFRMESLKLSVASYNAMYGTSFSVGEALSLTKDPDLPQLKDLDMLADKGGVFLFYDRYYNPLAVYSAKDFGTGLRSHIKSEKDNSDNWVIKGEWERIPAHVVFIIGNENKMYEKDSLRTYLISKFNPYYDENGINLSWHPRDQAAEETL